MTVFRIPDPNYFLPYGEKESQFARVTHKLYSSEATTEVMEDLEVSGQLVAV